MVCHSVARLMEKSTNGHLVDKVTILVKVVRPIAVVVWRIVLDIHCCILYMVKYVHI